MYYMDRMTLVKTLLPTTYHCNARNQGEAFAPSNIALCKYWGKRDLVLNLPMTSSLSISLGTKGANCLIREQSTQHAVTVNQKKLPETHEFVRKLTEYLTLFQPSPRIFYDIHFQFNIPIAAGVASSACSFASLILALDHLYQWQLEKSTLSILSRLGSGSACRSLWHGFVKWECGQLKTGMDSHGYPIQQNWPELRVGLHIITRDKKPISSREAMIRTASTSELYKAWPEQIAKDLTSIEGAIQHLDFEQLGSATESNALALHAMMMSSFPPIIYTQPETLESIYRVWALRKSGHPVYFTQDAGANLKLLFLEQAQSAVKEAFPDIEIIQPFAGA